MNVDRKHLRYNSLHVLVLRSVCFIGLLFAERPKKPAQWVSIGSNGILGTIGYLSCLRTDNWDCDIYCQDGVKSYQFYCSTIIYGTNDDDDNKYHATRNTKMGNGPP